MLTSARYVEAPRRLRAFVRAHETSLVVLAALVGTIGGLVVAAMSAAVEVLHVVLFNLEMGDRLSSQFRIEASWLAVARQPRSPVPSAHRSLGLSMRSNW
jgi:CIC family chloride channel protein